MYQPSFNSVLVEIDDKDAEWGGENNENMLGKSYSKGKVVSYGPIMNTASYPTASDITGQLEKLDLMPKPNTNIMWNEGTEAGTTFEHNGKLYGFIYWFDIRGVRE